jgi:hypothetical protein
MQNAKSFHSTYENCILFKCGNVLKITLPLFNFLYYLTAVIAFCHYVVFYILIFKLARQALLYLLNFKFYVLLK